MWNFVITQETAVQSFFEAFVQHLRIFLKSDFSRHRSFSLRDPLNDLRFKRRPSDLSKTNQTLLKNIGLIPLVDNIIVNYGPHLASIC